MFSLLAMRPAARAQVSFFGAQKTAFYTQTAENTAPGTVTNYSVFAFVDTQNAGDAAAFTASDHASITLTSSAGDPTSFGGSAFYNTKADLDAAFTAGDNYSFQAQGGALDGQSDAVPIGADAYAPVLYLTGSSFSNSLLVNPNGNYIFTIASTGGQAAATALSFGLYDPTTGAQVYAASFAAGTTSITVPQATLASLKPGEVYTASLDNFNTGGPAASGDFAGAATSDGFVSGTNFGFAVVPEPGAMAPVAAGLLALAGVWKWRARGRDV